MSQEDDHGEWGLAVFAFRPSEDPLCPKGDHLWTRSLRNAERQLRILAVPQLTGFLGELADHIDRLAEKVDQSLQRLTGDGCTDNELLSRLRDPEDGLEDVFDEES